MSLLFPYNVISNSSWRFSRFLKRNAPERESSDFALPVTCSNRKRKMQCACADPVAYMPNLKSLTYDRVVSSGSSNLISIIGKGPCWHAQTSLRQLLSRWPHKDCGSSGSEALRCPSDRLWPAREVVLKRPPPLSGHESSPAWTKVSVSSHHIETWFQVLSQFLDFPNLKSSNKRSPFDLVLWYYKFVSMIGVNVCCPA